MNRLPAAAHTPTSMTVNPTDDWPGWVGQCASLACLWEATAPKAGNVHRGADFEDLTYLDFATSAIVIRPAIVQAAAGGRLGPSLFNAVLATRQAVGTNTNLGMLLLIVPLAMVPAGELLQAGVVRVLQSLDAADAHHVYEAIRLANPGGMGKVDEADLQGPPPADLVSAMQLAADRDLVARQYADGFAEVFAVVLPALVEGQHAGWPWSDVITFAHLQLMSRHPDSLIARKCGLAVAEQAALGAARVLDFGRPGESDYHEALADFDFWLRADGHRRNPGTSADLITAGLFAALRDGIIDLPVRFYA